MGGLQNISGVFYYYICFIKKINNCNRRYIDALILYFILEQKMRMMLLKENKINASQKQN